MLILKKVSNEYYLLLLAPLFLCLGLNAKVAFAEENVDFSVRAIFPENQVNKNYTYFDLKMKPDQKQTIEVIVSNTSVEEETYTVSINQAYTNKQGFIDYAKKDAILDSSIKYPIKDIVKYEKEVTVPAEEAVKIPIEIQMPQESFDGQILAGIQVTKQQSEDSNQAISNEIGYILGLKLTENDNPVNREIQLESVKAAVSYGKTSIVVKLKNPTMDAIGKLKYKVNIKNEHTSKSIKKITYNSGMEMAPNSLYDFVVDWDGKRLVAGNYLMELVISDAKGNEWKFNEKFTITEKEANDINKVTIDIDAVNTSIPMRGYIVIGVAILLVAVLTLIAILKNKKRKNINNF